jgi:DNA-binding transcriptional ArsR family regulator
MLKAMSSYALADIAALIGVPARAAILTALVDGRVSAAGELATVAGLSPSAASLHLSKLVDGELVAVQQVGRHRYYRLASHDVAAALEALGAIATTAPPTVALSARQRALREARTCYDHLAGATAVSLTDMWLRLRVLKLGGTDFSVTSTGHDWFQTQLGIDVATIAASAGRRPLARRCLDWTERRPHVAGALGAAILNQCLRKRWVAPTDEPRRLRLTVSGRAVFERWTQSPPE